MLARHGDKAHAAHICVAWVIADQPETSPAKFFVLGKLLQNVVPRKVSS